jgi:hypothetical protein
VNLIEKGEATLSRLLGQDASIEIVYRRGEEAVSLPATVGMTDYEVDKQFGVERFISRDYFVDRKLLVLGEGEIEPQVGDRIWQFREGVTLVCDVLSPGGDMQCFEHSGETRWRIHTKIIETL